VRTFGIRRNEKIACHVTVRGEKAMNLIVRSQPRRAPRAGAAAAGGASRPHRQRMPACAIREGFAGGLTLFSGCVRACLLRASQESGLKVKEFELLRRNFSETGNFGARLALAPVGMAWLCSFRVGAAAHARARHVCSRHVCCALRLTLTGFGINEHIDLGLKYDPSTGIYGAWLPASQRRAPSCARASCGRFTPARSVQAPLGREGRALD
jgi:hypothetical protein